MLFFSNIFIIFILLIKSLINQIKEDGELNLIIFFSTASLKVFDMDHMADSCFDIEINFKQQNRKQLE